MFEQERISTESNAEFLRNAVGVEYVTGNPTLDGSKLTEGQVIKAGTAIHKNADTGLYELVSEPAEGEEGAILKNAVLTRDTVKVKTAGNDVHVSAISKGNPIEALTTGVTDQFKASNGLFFWY